MTTGRASGGAPACEPDRDCRRCARLVAYRAEHRAAHPDWFNAPVPSFGRHDARGLIVGLAPGLRGANRTGRPFTGDYAGELLYGTLIEFGLARGHYGAAADDGLQLSGILITNAVRCVPPENKPTLAEIRTCSDHLRATLAAMNGLRSILVLGRIAHESTLAALNLAAPHFPFQHGARFALPSGVTFHASYHCSRYNTQTGRLTPEMFRAVVASFAADVAG